MRIKVKIQKKTLPNGIKIVNIIDPATEISVVSGWFQVGSRDDPPRKEGLAHFMEHLYCVRTTKSKIERRQMLELNGILYNARTTKATTHFYQMQPISRTIASLKFLLDGIKNSVITKEDFNHEKISISNERNDYSNPYNDLSHLADACLWPNSPLTHDLLGIEETINNIHLEDVNRFRVEYYRPENLVIMVIGNLETRKLQNIISQFFPEKSRYVNKPPRKKYTYRSPIHKKIEIRDIYPTNIAIAFRAPAINSKDFHFLNFLLHCFTDNWSSILIKNLRIEKDYTYWVGGESQSFQDTGFIKFQYTCDRKYKQQSIDLALDLIEKTKKLSWWKENLPYYRSAYIPNITRKYSDPYEQMWWYGWQAILEENIVSLEDHLKAIKKLTPEKMARLCQKIFNKKNRAVAIIGPI